MSHDGIEARKENHDFKNCYSIVMIGIVGAEAKKKNNTLVSGNADDQKNLHPGGHNFFKNF